MVFTTCALFLAGFVFSSVEPSALIQEHGGPCAIIASVQVKIILMIHQTQVKRFYADFFPSGLTHKLDLFCLLTAGIFKNLCSIKVIPLIHLFEVSIINIEVLETDAL